MANGGKVLVRRREQVRQRVPAPQRPPVVQVPPRRPPRPRSRAPARAPESNLLKQRTRVPDPRPAGSNLDLARRRAGVERAAEPRRPDTPALQELEREQGPGVAPATGPTISTAPAPPASPSAPAAQGPAAPAPAAPAPAPQGPAPAAAAAARPGPAAAPGRRRRFAAHAGAIEADHRTKEAQARRIAATRVQQVAVTFAVVRAVVAATVGGAISGFRAQVATRQAQLLGVVASVVTAAQSLVSLVAATLVTGAVTAVTFISGLVTRALAAARSGVLAVTGRITGLISSISLPDIPGIAAIRARAVGFLTAASRFVTDRLADAAAVVRLVAGMAITLVSTLVTGAVALVRGAIAKVAVSLVRLVRTVAMLLLRLASVVAAALRRVLAAVVFPLLRRVQVFVVSRLGWALAQTLRLLRLNRDQQLASLDELDRARPLPPGTAATDATDPETAQDAARVVADARTNSARVVRLFDLVTGGAFRTALEMVRNIAVRLRAEVLRRVGLVVVRVVLFVAEVIRAARQVATLVAVLLRTIVVAIQRAILSIIERLRQAIQRPIDAVIAFAVTAFTRIRDFVVRFVRNLIAGIAEVVRDVASIVTGGTSTQSIGRSLERPGPITAKGPIVLPPPGPIVKPILTGLLFFVFVIGYIVLAKFAFLAPLVAFLLALGLSEFAVVVVIGVLALLLLALLLLILIVLIRTLFKKKPPKLPVKRVIAVNPAALELGVGGRDVAATATIAPGSPPSPRLVWRINPGGVVPARIRVIGSGRTVQVRASHPPAGTVTGGAPITVRAQLASNPGDFADSAGVMVVQVVEAHYDAVPPLAAVPPNSGPFPPNTVDPNRDGVVGSSANVVATTAPVGRPVLVVLRRPLGAVVAGTTITPGVPTGDILVRIVDDPTGAQLDEKRPSLLNPPTLMSTLVVNAVPTRVSSVTFTGRHAAGPYSAVNRIRFTPSDTRHPPLDRVVGELITHVRDDFNIPPPNGAFNPAFNPVLAVPTSFWSDQLVTPAGILHAVDGLPAIDVNRFLGPGVPALPRTLIYRQQMIWAAWRAGNVASLPIADGQHLRTLVKRFIGFGFTTHHTFAGVAPSTPGAEPYAGPPLIVLDRLVVTPRAPGATALAADGASTGDALVRTTVAGRPVSWTVLAGDISVPAGNPSVPPGTATVQAGALVGSFGLRAADSTYPNRQFDGAVNVQAVRLHSMSSTFAFRAASTVKVLADPGGRVVNWSLDPAAVAAGVTVAPAATGPGAARMTVTVTRPAGFTGTVVVTAVDSVVPAATASTTVKFRF